MRASLRFALLVVATLAVAACSQRPVPCTVGRSLPYAAKYQLTSTEGACDGVDIAALPGDLLGLSAYNQAGQGDLPDTTKVDVAIRTVLLGAPAAAAFDRGVVDADPEHKVAAVGRFASDTPDADGLCKAPALSETAQVLPELPEDVENELPLQPAVNLSERWRDVAVYVDASALGTQMKGTYAVTSEGCTATYQVMAMYPATDCTGEDGGPDQAVCDDPSTGISPDFAVVCDPTLLLCVLDADVTADLPVLKK